MPSSVGADVVVVGDGVVGLCAARALTRAGLGVQLIGKRLPGAASSASAGLLAPTIDPFGAGPFEFALSCRDRYPSFINELAEETGLPVPLRLEGVLRVALRDEEASTLLADRAAGTRWLSTDEVRDAEPMLAPTLGGVLHPGDGAVDAERLVAALDAAISLDGISRAHGRVETLDRAGATIRCTVTTGEVFEAHYVVVACGAWVGQLVGLPRTIPVRPLHGEMAEAGSITLGRPVFGGGGYLVPRVGGSVMVGATSVEAGFLADTTPNGQTHLAAVSARLFGEPKPAYRAWAGLRPMSPDGLPIIGPDADDPRIIYACGHSRNGILMAPETAWLIADWLAFGRNSPAFSHFSASRTWPETA